MLTMSDFFLRICYAGNSTSMVLHEWVNELPILKLQKMSSVCDGPPVANPKGSWDSYCPLAVTPKTYVRT